MARLLNAFAVFLSIPLITACLSQDSIGTSNQVQSPSSADVRDSCTRLSDADKTSLNNLENQIAAFTPTVYSSGDFDPNSIQQLVYELARRGCPESAPALVALSSQVEASETLNASGLLVLEFQGPAALIAASRAFGAIGNDNSDVISVLSGLSSEQTPFQDGYDGHAIQDAAARSLQTLQSQLYDETTIPAYLVTWNPDIGQCSASYLQTDGTTTAYVSDWNAYEAQIEALDPLAAKDLLLALLLEPLSCDGSSGYVIQSLAADGLASSDPSFSVAGYIQALEKHRFRGAAVLPHIVNGIRETLQPNELAQVEGVFPFISGPARHADENVRAGLISILEEACAATSSDDVHKFCNDTLRPTLSEVVPTDPYKIVRMTAHDAKFE